MDNNKIKLVLMSCCAPCSAGAIKQLADGQIPGVDDFIVLFFNPNIFPAGEYDHAAWRDAVRGMEDAPERGVRCSACFKFRFEYARRWAAAHGYNAVTSVFGVSRHKSQFQVDDAGIAALGAQYIPVKWDENLRQQIGRESQFYRQNYCGCEFSIRKTGDNKAKFTTAVPVR